MAFPFYRYNVTYQIAPYQKMIGLGAMALFGLDLAFQLRKLWVLNNLEKWKKATLHEYNQELKRVKQLVIGLLKHE